LIIQFQKYVDEILNKKEKEYRNYIADGRCRDIEDYRARCTAVKTVMECRAVIKEAVPAFVNDES
jgi:hypothetical protein